MTRCSKVNQRTKATPDVLDAAWSTVLSTLRSAEPSKEEDRASSLSVDVTLLTGFLGSGKTTVLRHLLENPGDLKIAVVINDVGALEVDARLVQNMTREQISLSNGCVCCALSDDLSEQLRQLSPNLYDVVVVEASGVADPVNISQVIHGLPGCRLDGIVAVADPTSIDQYRNDPHVAPLLTRQLQTAHIVLVSKDDLVDENERRQALNTISALSPGSRVIPIAQGQVDPQVVFGAAINGVSLPNGDQPRAFQFTTTTVSPAGPWDPLKLGSLLDATDHRLLRGKGWFFDHDGHLFQLQIVGRRWSIDSWVGDAPVGVVLIGTDAGDVARTATIFRGIKH